MQLLRALCETMETVVEGAGERYEGLRDCAFGEVESWASGTRGKEEDYSSGDQISFGR